LPEAKIARFVNELGITQYDAEVLVADRAMAEYYDSLVALHGNAKLCANWVMGELQRALNDSGVAIADCPVTPPMLDALLKRIDDNTISNKIAKTVFDAMWQSGKDADVIIAEQGLKQVSDTGAIEAAIDEVMAANPGQVEEYRGGKDKLMGFFVGQVMRATKGKANPQTLNDLLQKKLAGE